MRTLSDKIPPFLDADELLALPRMAKVLLAGATGFVFTDEKGKVQKTFSVRAEILDPPLVAYLVDYQNTRNVRFLFNKAKLADGINIVPSEEVKKAEEPKPAEKLEPAAGPEAGAEALILTSGNVDPEAGTPAPVEEPARKTRAKKAEGAPVVADFGPVVELLERLAAGQDRLIGLIDDLVESQEMLVENLGDGNADTLKNIARNTKRLMTIQTTVFAATVEPQPESYFDVPFGEEGVSPEFATDIPGKGATGETSTRPPSSGPAAGTRPPASMPTDQGLPPD